MDLTCRSSLRGTSLAEVAVALGLAALLLASVAPVSTMAVNATARARITTRAGAAAVSQLERLRSLPWYALPAGGEARDNVSALESEGFASGGPGLSPAAVDTLDADTVGYADTPPSIGLLPASSDLARRWTVTALPSDPACVVLVVEVAPVNALATGQQMDAVAVGRAQTVRCRGGATP